MEERGRKGRGIQNKWREGEGKGRGIQNKWREGEVRGRKGRDIQN